MVQQWKWVALGGGLVALGMVLGSQLVSAPPAVAQTSGYRECFFGRQETVDINSDGIVRAPDRAHSIVMPTGYELAGSGGLANHGIVLFCRR